MSNIFSDENMASAKSNISSRVNELRRSASDGDFSIRLLALLAGVALLLSAMAGIFYRIMTFNLTGALMEVYTLLLAVVILVLESRQLNLPDQFMRNVYKVSEPIAGCLGLCSVA